QNGRATDIAERKGVEVEFQASLVVAADGRRSATRRKARFEVQQGADHLRMAGLLFEDLPVPEDTVQTWRDTWADASTGLFVLLFPQGNQRVRAYVACQPRAEYRLSGSSLIP